MRNMDMIERTAEGKEKNGVFTGWHVINPVTGDKVQLWAADYVLNELRNRGCNGCSCS